MDVIAIEFDMHARKFGDVEIILLSVNFLKGSTAVGYFLSGRIFWSQP